MGCDGILGGGGGPVLSEGKNENKNFIRCCKGYFLKRRKEENAHI